MEDRLARVCRHRDTSDEAVLVLSGPLGRCQLTVLVLLPAGLSLQLRGSVDQFGPWNIRENKDIGLV